MHLGKLAAICVGDQFDQRLAENRLELVGLQHFQARRVYLPQAAVGTDDIDAFRLVFDNRLQVLLVFLQLLFLSL